MNKFWTVDQLAEYLQLPSKKWIYSRTKKDGPEVIPHIRLGKYIRFQPESEEFKKWLSKNEVKGTSLG